MKAEGGHSNYNTSTDVGSRSSITFPVAKMPFDLQKKVLEEVRISLSLKAHFKCIFDSLTDLLLPR